MEGRENCVAGSIQATWLKLHMLESGANAGRKAVWPFPEALLCCPPALTRRGDPGGYLGSWLSYQTLPCRS